MKDLYSLMGLEKTASQDDIRKSYLKMAVRLHPDKNPDDATSHDNFQSLQKAYAILSDPQKRKIYDQTGDIDSAESLTGEQFDNLYNFYRSQYAKVTEGDIVSFQNQYRGSASETSDLLQHYTNFKGKMKTVFEFQMCSYEDRDSHRFMEIIEKAVKANKVEEYKPFLAWSKKVKKTTAPTNPLAPIKQQPAGNGKGKGGGKKGKKDSNDEMPLLAAIRGKQGGGGAFDSLVRGLGAKYGVDVGDDEPTDAEFETARKRLEKKKKKGSDDGDDEEEAENKKSKKKKKE
jgi:DnaJ family protein C protein 9